MEKFFNEAKWVIFFVGMVSVFLAIIVMLAGVAFKVISDLPNDNRKLMCYWNGGSWTYDYSENGGLYTCKK